MDVERHCVKASPNQSFWSWRDSREFGYQRAIALLGCHPSANMFYIAAGEKVAGCITIRIERM
jgi:hypothetical protein